MSFESPNCFSFQRCFKKTPFLSVPIFFQFSILAGKRQNVYFTRECIKDIIIIVIYSDHNDNDDRDNDYNISTLASFASAVRYSRWKINFIFLSHQNLYKDKDIRRVQSHLYVFCLYLVLAYIFKMLSIYILGHTNGDKYKVSVYELSI